MSGVMKKINRFRKTSLKEEWSDIRMTVQEVKKVIAKRKGVKLEER